MTIYCGYKYYMSGTTINGTKVGNPVTSNGAVSEMTTSSYYNCNLAQTFAIGSVDSYDICFRFARPWDTPLTSNGRIFNFAGGADSIQGPYLEMLSSGQVALNWYDGSTRDKIVATSSAPKGFYIVRYIKTKGSNVIKVYSGTSMNNLTSVSNFGAKVRPRFTTTAFQIGGRPADHNSVCVFKGTVDLRRSWIIVNGIRWDGTTGSVEIDESTYISEGG